MRSQPNHFKVFFGVEVVVAVNIVVVVLMFVAVHFGFSYGEQKFNCYSCCFSNGPDDVGRWQRATFLLLFFFFFQGTSIGLVRTNHALLSLVDTNLA